MVRYAAIPSNQQQQHLQSKTSPGLSLGSNRGGIYEWSLVCLVRGLAIFLLFHFPQTAAAPTDVNNLSDAISPQMQT